jgi:hypothetical protein
MMAEITPCWTSFERCSMLSFNQQKRIQLDLALEAKPNFERILNQNSLVKTQVVIICWTFSSSWSQTHIIEGVGDLFFASRSAIQHLFLIASQDDFALCWSTGFPNPPPCLKGHRSLEDFALSSSHFVSTILNR